MKTTIIEIPVPESCDACCFIQYLGCYAQMAVCGRTDEEIHEDDLSRAPFCSLKIRDDSTLERLADYEASGFTPEQVVDLKRQLKAVADYSVAFLRKAGYEHSADELEDRFKHLSEISTAGGWV